MNRKISLSLSLALALCLTSACAVKNDDSASFKPQSKPAAVTAISANADEYNNQTEKEAAKANLQAFSAVLKLKILVPGFTLPMKVKLQLISS